jgi:hypothetical protein
MKLFIMQFSPFSCQLISTNITIKLSLCLTTHNAKVAYREVEVHRSVLLTSTLDGVSSQPSRPDRDSAAEEAFMNTGGWTRDGSQSQFGRCK